MLKFKNVFFYFGDTVGDTVGDTKTRKNNALKNGEKLK